MKNKTEGYDEHEPEKPCYELAKSAAWSWMGNATKIFLIPIISPQIWMILFNPPVYIAFNPIAHPPRICSIG